MGWSGAGSEAEEEHNLGVETQTEYNWNTAISPGKTHELLFVSLMILANIDYQENTNFI